jgi:hypothetical protein
MRAASVGRGVRERREVERRREKRKRRIERIGNDCVCF